MGVYRNRVGQQTGPWEVVADHKRTAHGKVVWQLRNCETGRLIYLPTYRLIQLDRTLNPNGNSA